jgi:hypothetical protein
VLNKNEAGLPKSPAPPPKVDEIEDITRVLTQYSYEDLEVLEFHFYQKTSVRLHEAIEKYLSRAPASENRIVLIGLALGPVEFDSWLLRRVSQVLGFD